MKRVRRVVLTDNPGLLCKKLSITLIPVIGHLRILEYKPDNNFLNQNPEQLARDKIDAELIRCGWTIQNKNQINLKAATGIAIREYQTNVGPADYVLFADVSPVRLRK